MDYPHPESVIDRSDAVMKGIFDKVGEARGRRILGANAADLWSI